jgi:hypothetical protein
LPIGWLDAVVLEEDVVDVVVLVAALLEDEQAVNASAAARAAINSRLKGHLVV